MSSGACFQCGKYGHFADQCFFKANANTKSIHSKGTCFSCGKIGHFADECFVDKDINKSKRRRVDFDGFEDVSSNVKCFKCWKKGHYASQCFIQLNEKKKKRNEYATKRSGVYAIQYPNGQIYIGKSDNIDKRISQHTVEQRHHRGIPREISTISEAIPNDLESWERNETLAQMMKNGIENVRGWMYTSEFLSEDQEDSIMSQICEKYDLCRNCGKAGHFANDCHDQSTSHHIKKNKKNSINDYDPEEDCSSEDNEDSEEDYSSYED